MSATFLALPTRSLAKQYKVSIETLNKHICSDSKYRFYNGKNMESHLYEGIQAPESYDQLENVLASQKSAFKVNIALGYDLVSLADDEETRYLHPNLANTYVFSSPLKAITGFKIYIYYRNHALGDSGAVIPKIIRDNKHVINFPKTNNKCVFHCIAWHLHQDSKKDPRKIQAQVKDVFKRYCSFKGIAYTLSVFRGFKPLDLLQFDGVEDCFQFAINIYKMDVASGEVECIRRSDKDVEKHGAESFLYPIAAQSAKCSATASSTGDGYSNNTAISTTFTAEVISAASVANNGFAKRLLSNPPNAGADSSTSWPSKGAASATTTIANQLGRGAFVAGSGTAGSIMGTWNYMLMIKLPDLHPIFEELDLMANPQIRLRFRVNQGTSAIDIDSSSRMTLTSTTLLSGNPTTDGTYMPFTTSRLYVAFVHLENPQAIISKPVKKVRFNDCYAQLFYQRAGIGKQSTQLNAASNLQLSAFVKNAKYVILLPFAEQTGSFASAAVQQFQSPFDSAPWTLHPGSSIQNFNVHIGSPQCFDISHDYDFHQFADEVSKNSSINGDLTSELAIQIQGVNAGCQGTNMIVLVVSEQELSNDRLTGEVLKFTTA
ncbi:unnamed protein product [Phytophthora lilii]|uniref:Unnamed protein product n=1 Tax=Phytophthora lilii TaxID=2077276 RepID=A0A9W6U0L0_9STRA|nr:unnamed protein product [Phytophthora lilii]